MNKKQRRDLMVAMGLLLGSIALFVFFGVL